MSVESGGKVCLSDVGVYGQDYFVGNSEGYLSKWIRSPDRQGQPVTVEPISTCKVGVLCGYYTGEYM